MTAGVAVPIEALATLRRRLAVLPGRHPQRETLLSSTAELYGISRATLYRLLRGERRPRDAHRADRGTPRVGDTGRIAEAGARPPDRVDDQSDICAASAMTMTA